MANKYLYYDLETTGLDPAKHRILEIAAVAVDDKLNITEEIELVVNDGPLDDLDPFIINMHTQSGLLREVEFSEITTQKADMYLHEFILRNYGPGERVVLAGHSPHGVDLPFTNHHLLHTAKLISHRVRDTGAMVRAWQEESGKPFKEGEVLGHRALADVQGALDEFRRLVQEWRK